MGPYEAELKSVTSAIDWSIPHLSDLQTALTALDGVMGDVATSPGWTGKSADQASEWFLLLQKSIRAWASASESVSASLADANHARAVEAYDAYATLPSATVDPFWHAAALAGGTLIFPGLGTLAAEGAVQQIQSHLKAEREKAAQAALEALRARLALPMMTENPSYPAFGLLPAPQPDPEITGPGYGSGYGGSGSVGGGYTGGGSGGGYDPYVDPDPIGFDDPILGGPGLVGTTHPSVDGSTDGHFPGGGIGGLVGGGASAAALAAGARLAGSGAGGLSGAGMTPGLGGLLGGPGGGAAGAGATSGAAAAGKGGSSMMGAPGGGGGQSKDKRAGLGGLIAPKLEDDEEAGPRSAGARAGGRDQAGE